jgi:hypothetical protein
MESPVGGHGELKAKKPAPSEDDDPGPLRTEMLCEPLRRGIGCTFELIGVGREMPAWIKFEPFRLSRPVEGGQCQIGRTHDVGVSYHHD